MPHSIDIYRGSSLYVTIKPDDTSVQVKQVMNDNTIQLDFQLSYEAKFKINDWCTVFGEKFQIVDNPPPVTKVSKYKFRYSLKMKSEQSDLEKVSYLFLGDAPYSLRIPEFSLMGNAVTFINLLLQNANRDLTGWTAGQVIDTSYKNLSFSGDNLLTALAKIADAFDTEWWIEGKVIHLTKRSTDRGITLKHGRARGLYEINRQASDGSKIVTVIWVFGGKTNIPADYGSERLRLFSGSGVASQLTRNTEIYGVVEKAVFFDDIYPTRTGKVTGVDATNVYKFSDSTMNFNLNDYLIGGLSGKVVFNTGQLAGYTFEVSNYNNATKEITILKNADETTLDVPSVSLKPQIGDEYVFVDIKLPDEYVSAAELKLYQTAAAWLLDNADPKFSFSITLDPTFVKVNNYSFSIGDLIWITDSDLEVDKKIRVTQTSRNIIKENNYSLTLSDSVPQGTIQTINSSISTAQQGISQISNQLQNGALFNKNVIGDLNIQQGTIVAGDLPTTNTSTGFNQLLIDGSGRVYKLV